MRAGGGKAKGAAFERKIAKHLSLWYSQGKREDLFWRSSMSGGRDTVNRNKLSAVAGDICSTAGDNDFLNHWILELKHVADLRLETWLLKGEGQIQGWLIKLGNQALTHEKHSMLIMKQNGLEPLVVGLVHQVENWWPDFCPTPLLQLEYNRAFPLGLWWFDDLFPLPARLEKPRAKPIRKRPSLNRPTAGRVQVESVRTAKRVVPERFDDAVDTRRSYRGKGLPQQQARKSSGQLSKTLKEILKSK